VIKERWTKWNPIKGLGPKYFIYYTKYSDMRLEILLEDLHDKKKDVRMVFNSIFFYRVTMEFGRLLTIDFLNQNYEYDFYSKWTFFKVFNSEDLIWISNRSKKLSHKKALMHFSFIDVDNISDVIASEEPKVMEIRPSRKKILSDFNLKAGE
jgi:hypothetical protein